jgi:hypothetical protein
MPSSQWSALHIFSALIGCLSNHHLTAGIAASYEYRSVASRKPHDFQQSCIFDHYRIILLSPAIRHQAYGESLDPDRAGKLQAYDLRLDRQFERALSTLLQLQASRRTVDARQAPTGALARVAS